MRRLARGILAVSLLAAVAAAGLWARSYFAHDVLMFYRPGVALAAHSSRGQLLLVRGRPAENVGSTTRWHRGPPMPLRGPNLRRALDPLHPTRIEDDTLSSVPHWLLFALAALPSAGAAGTYVGRRRRRRWARPAGK